MSKNLGLEMADITVQAIEALNKTTPSRTFELYKAIQKAQEENEKTAKAQGKRAFPHGIASVVTLVLSMVGQVFKDANNPIGDLLINMSKTPSDVANICAALGDKTITIYSHATRAWETNSHRKAQDENNIDSTISRIAEQAGRLIALQQS